MTQVRYVQGRHTTIHTEGGWTKVTYHRTVVVKFTDKEVVLNSGGWRRTTTKVRMNQYGLGFGVYQKDFDWFVKHGGKDLPFEDGMTLRR